MSVAIIGAGPSGLIALDAVVRENKFDKVKVFERNTEAGGTWLYYDTPAADLGNLERLSTKNAVAFDPSEVPESLPAHAPKRGHRFEDTLMYLYLETNVDSTSMEFSEEPMPVTVTENLAARFGPDSPFRHRSEVKKWVQSLHKRKGYEKHVEFNCSVELAEKTPQGKWKLLVREIGKENDYYREPEEFDYLLVASGQYYVPYIPQISGLQEFQDRTNSVYHTKQFRSREPFRGKTVVVVGGSISAVDAIHDTINVAKKVISSRRSEEPNSLYGPVPFEHPLLDKRSQIERIDAPTQTVYFTDGSHAIVDCIIFATGYTLSYPFLPDLKIDNNRVVNLYQLVSYIPDPTLAFVGNLAGGLTFKVFEWQAVLAARIFAGRSKVPSQDEQYQWEQDRIAQKGNSYKYSHLFPDFEEYFEGIRAVATNDGPGRKLPPFDQRWHDLFVDGFRRRVASLERLNGGGFYIEPAAPRVEVRDETVVIA